MLPLDRLFLPCILLLLPSPAFSSPVVAGFDRLMLRVLVSAAALHVATEAFFTFAGDSGDDGLGQEVPGTQVLLGERRKLKGQTFRSLLTVAHNTGSHPQN